MNFKTITLSALFVAVGFSGISQELPEVSSATTIKQRIGLTDVEITYSRPNVNEREVFGKLVPFKKIWRLGANACTKFTTSSDIDFGEFGGVLPAGKYALFATPIEDHWIFHFNKNTEQWGTYNYNEEEDVFKAFAPVVEPTHLEESMSIRFADVTTTSGIIVVEWAKTKVMIPFTVPTEKLAVANIETAIKKGENLAKVYSNAAEYYSEQLENNKQALVYAEKSLSLEKSIAGYFTKAQILKEMGKTKEAIQNAVSAEKMAIKQKSGWAGYIRKTINKWEQSSQK